MPADSLQPSDDFSRSLLKDELEVQLAWLGRAARGLGFSGSDADDLVQSVAATFLEVMPRFEGRSSVRTFLFGIMRRKAAEMRRRTKRPDHDVATSQSGVNCADAETLVSNAELGQLLSKCIEQLPPNQRLAAGLRFGQEQEAHEVGRALGISGNYLGVLIHRAREHLRDCVGRHGFLP
jgi:RNA polymerase sigma-70 factor (ECF subfamily)